MPRRVVIFSADIGEGHATAAHALARSLRAAGAEVSVQEDLSSLGRLNRLVLRDGSRLLFRWAPWLYDALYHVLLHSSLARRGAAGSLRRFGARPLLRSIQKIRPDVIVSTYPGVTVVLGTLRRQGRLTIPTVATITDLAGLFFWAHPGMDLHLTAWEESLEEARLIARGADVRHVGALTSPEFFAKRTKREARRALDLPSDRPVIVVSGGGWGVGHLDAAVRAACDLSSATVICVAGRNARLRLRLQAAFGDRSGVRILGFTDQMSDLLAAADVLVHGTGGVTCLEAKLRGCPVVIYGFPTGHVRYNTKALESRGLARRARTTRELSAALRELIASPTPAAPGVTHLDPAALVLAAQAAPQPPRHRVVTSVRRGAVAALASGAMLLSTGAGFSMAAGGLDLDPLTHVSVRSQAVAVVVRGPPDAIVPVAGELRRLHATASFAVLTPPSPPSMRVAKRDGLELVPALPAGELVRWVATAERLGETRDALHLSDHFRYLMPPGDFTFGQYLLAHRSGGEAMAAQVTISSPPELSDRGIRSGDVVELRVPDSPVRVAAQVRASVLALRRAGFEPSSVTVLAGHQ